MKQLLLFLFFSMAIYAHAQSPESFLDNSVKLQTYPVVLKDKVGFFNADIINVALAVNLGNPYNDTQIAGTYILKDKNRTTLFNNMQDLYSSPEFREALSAKIKTYEDAVPLSSFFRTLNNGLSFGYYFNIGNKWYFTTSDGGFFGADGFVLTCSGNGTIENIEMQYDIKFEMPEEAKRNEDASYTDLSDFSISAEDKELVLQELKKKADYSFTTSPAPEYKLGKLEMLTGELTVSEKYDDMESTGTYPFLIIKNGEEYTPVQDKSYLLENELYRDAVKSEFALKTDADAMKFRAFLDKFMDADAEVKSHKKVAGDVWFFANTTSFEDTLGVLLLTDKKGQIKAFAPNSKNTKKDILSLKMQDPDFKVDYEFKLAYPSKTEIETTEDKKIEVEISFNEDFVNASDAWIATMANSKPVGMNVSTDGLNSPFGDQIPASYLGKGVHTVEYLLMKPGDDYENPLSKITLIITIK